MKRFRILAILLAVTLIISITPSSMAYEGIDPLPDLSKYETRVMLDGAYLDAPAPIHTEDGAILPLRAILEGADYEVTWNAAERAAVLTYASGVEYTLYIEDGKLLKNGTQLYQDPYISVTDGSTFVSVDMFQQLDGLTVTWDPATNTAVVVTDTPDDNLYIYDLGEGELTTGTGASIPYQMQGIVGVPEGTNRPVAIILHGSHPISQASQNRYDLGFSYLVDALADAGYLAISMNIAMNYSFEAGEPLGNERTLQIVEQQLQQLKKAIDGESTAFPVDLTDKGDLEQIVLIGHSRGGGDSFAVAESLPDFASVQGILALAPANTIFYTPEIGSPDIPVGIIIPQYDGDVTMLEGASIFEQIRGNDVSSAELIYLEDGNHGGFSTALVRPDPFNDPSDLPEIMPASKQQEFTVEYTLEFMKAVTESHTTPMGVRSHIPDSLYGYPVVIRSYHQETTIFTAADENAAAVTGHNAQIQNVFSSYTPDSTAGTFQLPGSFLRYDLISITWDKPGASVTIPVSGGTGSALRIDLAQDSSQALNKNQDLSISITVKDSRGAENTLKIPAGSSPLRHQAGTIKTYDNWDGTQTAFYSTFTPLGSIRISESELPDVDFSALESVTLTLETDSGAIMLREVATEA